MYVTIVCMKCLFCDIVENRATSFKVWENEHFLAFLDTTPINPGHILLIPKEHKGEVFDLSDVFFKEIFQIVKNMVKPLKKVMSAKKIGVAIEGLGVSHAHIHIVPIHKGNDLNPERASISSKKDLFKMQKVLVSNFKNLK